VATPARPSGSGRTTRASAQGTGRAAALHDAQLVIAREYGFASWPRWKQFVEARGLDTQARAGELVRAACSPQACWRAIRLWRAVAAARSTGSRFSTRASLGSCAVIRVARPVS